MSGPWWLAGLSTRVLRSGHVEKERLTMPNVTLLHSPTCGACPSAKRVWKELRVKYSFSYREVDITTTDGQELANRHSVRAVPATIIDGRLTFVGVPPRESAEKALRLKIRPPGA
jgi:glutaredoxin